MTVTTSSAVIQQAAVQQAVQKGATGAAIVDPMKARSDQIFTENYHLKREVALHRERFGNHAFIFHKYHKSVLPHLL